MDLGSFVSHPQDSQAGLTSVERGLGGGGRKALVWIKKPDANLGVLHLSCWGPVLQS